MNEKDYSLKIRENGDVLFQFDKKCNVTYGNPSVTTKTSIEMVPATNKEPAQLIKTTVIKEKYKLKEKEIQKQDLEFALSLIEAYHSLLTIDLLIDEERLVPGSISVFRISKVKDREDLFKVQIDLQYDQYFEGELQAKKVKERGSFLMNKEQLNDTYTKFKYLSIKESISLLQVLKKILKEILIPEDNISEKATVAKTTPVIEREEDELTR